MHTLTPMLERSTKKMVVKTSRKRNLVKRKQALESGGH